MLLPAEPITFMVLYMSTTITLRQFAKVYNGQIHLTLPDEFNYDEVEVIIMPRPKQIAFEETSWDASDLRTAGKIGQSSTVFPEDDEDYSRW